MGGMEVGDTDAIQGTVYDVIYNLWRMKEHNCAIRMIANSDRLLADDTCNQTVRRWKYNLEDVVKKFKYKLKFVCSFFNSVRLMNTETSVMQCRKLNIHG